MLQTKILVEDALLRELSSETRKIGSRVFVRSSTDHPSFVADILDVIILPYSVFYRGKFMGFYKMYNHNSVKALKELSHQFPFIPDYELGIGYILNVHSKNEPDTTLLIKIKEELDFS